MRIIFIGAVEFSQRALKQLIDIEADVVGVCTLEQSVFNSDHVNLSALCENHNIDWCYAPNINSAKTIQWIADRCPDVIFCFGWSRLIQKQLLDLPPLGVVGFHPTALPANRGRHPLIWALVLGLKETASTFFFMDEAADSGDILSQEMLQIADADDAASLYEKVTLCGLKQIKIFVPLLATHSFSRIKQNEQYANVWRKRGKIDGQIDWRMSAVSIRNLVRALAKPYVGAHFLYHGEEIKVWEVEVISDVPQNIEFGKILDASSGAALVKCGEQGLRLLKTEPLFRPIDGEYL